MDAGQIIVQPFVDVGVWFVQELARTAQVALAGLIGHW